MVAGVAVGAAAVGYVIDSSGAQAGFVAVVIAGLLLTVGALFVRGPHPRVQPNAAQPIPPVLSPDSTGAPAAESSRPPVGTRN
jgi:hypothetical protein